jgi:hypothetical protein
LDYSGSAGNSTQHIDLATLLVSKCLNLPPPPLRLFLYYYPYMVVIEAIAGAFTVSNIILFGGFIKGKTPTSQVNTAEKHLKEVLALLEQNKTILEQAELHLLLERYDRFASAFDDRDLSPRVHSPL